MIGSGNGLVLVECQTITHKSGLILGLRPAKESRCFFVTASFFGWVQASIESVLQVPGFAYPYQGLIYWQGLTLIIAWITNYIHYKVWDEITYPILKLQFKFENGCWSLGNG